MPQTFEDMFKQPVAPAVPVTVTPAASGRPDWNWLIMLVLVIALVYTIVARNDVRPTPEPKPDDQQQVEPGPWPSSLVLKDHILVVVRDKKTLNEDVEYAITMQDDEFWSWAKSVCADVEMLEDDDELAVAVLAKIKDKAPCVALINTKTKQAAWSMPLPKGGTDSIRSKLK